MAGGSALLSDDIWGNPSHDVDEDATAGGIAPNTGARALTEVPQREISDAGTENSRHHEDDGDLGTMDAAVLSAMVSRYSCMVVLHAHRGDCGAVGRR